jgi:uncharacterized protein (DUF983 family)
MHGGSSSKRSAWQFVGRALRLRCPECGQARIFKPWRQTRSLDDWFRPLHGCPNCNYLYEPEEGYFLVATWVLNYAIVVIFGFGLAFILEALFAPSLLVLIACCVAPMPILSFLLVRHSKALFIAMDHYFDPQAGRSKTETIS